MPEKMCKRKHLTSFQLIILGFAGVILLGSIIERITNLKYRVADLRMFSENDVRFLDEFVSAD